MRPMRAMTAPGSLPLREARPSYYSQYPLSPLDLTTWPTCSLELGALFDPQSVTKMKCATFRDRFAAPLAPWRFSICPTCSRLCHTVACTYVSQDAGAKHVPTLRLSDRFLRRLLRRQRLACSLLSICEPQFLQLHFYSLTVNYQAKAEKLQNLHTSGLYLNQGQHLDNQFP